MSWITQLKGKIRATLFSQSIILRRLQFFRTEISSGPIREVLRGNAVDTIDEHEKLVGLFPEDSNAHAGLAGAAFKISNYKVAIESWTEAFRIRERNAVPKSWHLSYARALIANGSVITAEAHLIELMKTPKYVDVATEGLIMVAQAENDYQRALDLSKDLHRQTPDLPIAKKIRHGNLLSKNGEHEASNAVFSAVLENDPDNLNALLAFLQNLRNARNYQAALTFAHELYVRFQEREQVVHKYILCLLDTLEFEQAQDVYDQNLAPESSCRYLVLQATILHGQQKSDKALSVLESLGQKFPSVKYIVSQQILILMLQCKAAGDLFFAEKALRVIDAFLKEQGSSQQFEERRVDCLIILGRDVEARESIEKLRRQSSRKVMEFKVWASGTQGDVHTAKMLWKSLKRNHFIPQTSHLDFKHLTKVEKGEVIVNEEDILLFTAVRNERWRLPWFLTYYRSLGVDLFFFVDNGSNDGTLEFLREQIDVVLFQSHQNYAQAYAGIRWINTLVKRYGDGCWCIYVDVDEAMVFPGSETCGLRLLTQYMRANGHEAMRAFMLDMISPSLESEYHGDQYTGFLDDYSFFDSRYDQLPTTQCPFVYTTGGIRREFGTHDNQTKTPIIRGGAGINFLQSSHAISPAVISDVSGALLHFKLAGNFEAYLSSEVSQQTRGATCNKRHWIYKREFERFYASRMTRLDRLTRFESSRQLAQLGLIESSEKFDLALSGKKS